MEIDALTLNIRAQTASLPSGWEFSLRMLFSELADLAVQILGRPCLANTHALKGH